MQAIKIENITKIYPTNFPRVKKFLKMPVKPPVTALQNVSLEIAENETFGLIGRNGAGKTTLTKIIATLVQPTHGKVCVKGFDSVREEVRVRSLVGLATAEERSFYWRLSCEKNMMFFARLYGLTDREAKKRIGEIFERIGLTNLSHRRFSELSTGNKQRLAVARALLPQPPVLLLDEPTRSLDPLAAADMRELIASLENVSILLTSHNLAEIEQLCDRVGVISNGEIRAVDTPENLRRRQKTTQTVRLYLKTSGEIDLQKVVAPYLPDCSIEKNNGKLRLAFNRESDDEILGRLISDLHDRNVTVIDIETETATLLDVLESFE